MKQYITYISLFVLGACTTAVGNLVVAHADKNTSNQNTFDLAHTQCEPVTNTESIMESQETGTKNYQRAGCGSVI